MLKGFEESERNFSREILRRIKEGDRIIGAVAKEFGIDPDSAKEMIVKTGLGSESRKKREEELRKMTWPNDYD